MAPVTNNTGVDLYTFLKKFGLEQLRFIRADDLSMATVNANDTFNLRAAVILSFMEHFDGCGDVVVSIEWAQRVRERIKALADFYARRKRWRFRFKLWALAHLTIIESDRFKRGASFSRSAA